MNQHFQAWAATDVGRKRKHNEDSFLVDPSIGLYVVADGMGGYEGGDVASRFAVKQLQKRILQKKELFLSGFPGKSVEYHRQQIRYFLDQAVQDISNRILTLAREKGPDVRMGTTLCSLILVGKVAAVVHVGDSRCYLARQDKLYQLTEDHSLVVEQLKMGLITAEEAASSRYRNVITRAVGLADRLQVDIFFIDLQPGDRFLLCSDGLHGYFKGDEALDLLKSHEPKKLPQKLIDYANESGGKDNITAIVACVSLAKEAPIDDMVTTDISSGINVLQSNPLFASMSYAEILKVYPMTLSKTVKAGETLIKEGDDPDYIYILQSGSMDVLRDDEHIAQLKEGDYIGEMGVFDGEAYSATVIAKEDSTCMALPRDALLQLLKQESEMSFKIQQGLIKALCQRLRSTSHELAWTRREWRRSMPPGHGRR